MSVAEVTSSTSTPATGSSFTISITVSGSNPALIVKVGLDSATATVSSVSWSGGSGTTYQIKNVRSANGAFVSHWAIPAPGAGAGTVTVNLSASVPHIGTATLFSGTDQVTPAPIADAVSSTTQTPPVTLTPANLTANDASDGLAGNVTSGNWNSLTQNQRFVDNTSDPGYISGDSSGTTGITFTNDGGVPAGSAAQVAVRVQTPQGITGTGTVSSQASSAAGAGTVTGTVLGTAIFLYQGESNPNDIRLVDPTQVASTSVHGTGILLDSSSTLTGVGTSRSTGTGILLDSASAVAGTGTVSSPVTITGSGAPIDQSSTVAGVGTSRSTGTGALVDSASTVAGTGVVGAVAVGVLLSQSSTLAGLAAARWIARSELYLLEDGSGHYLLEDGSGRYAIEEVRILPSASQISGTGTTISTGSGSLVAGGSTIAGNDVVEPTGPVSKTRHIIYVKGRKARKSSHRELDEMLDRIFNPAPDETLPPEPVVEKVEALVKPFVYRNELDLAKLYKNAQATRALFELWTAEAARMRDEAEDDDESILLMS